MGADWPGEADEPSDRDSSPRGSRSGASRPAPAETRSRHECYDDLYRQVSAATQQAVAEEQAQAEKWDQSARESRWMWTEYERRWPPEERSSENPPGDSPEYSSQSLDVSVYQELEDAYDDITQREEKTFSPAMREIESRDLSRRLVGFEHRLKESGRIIEKAADRIEEKNRSPEEAISLIPDAIRYTFQYGESRYTQGVLDDIARLKEHGFELVKCRNFWTGEQYKGVNSQWIEPSSGQRFEVQFHTSISFEAKQLTHGSYERLRSGYRDEFERMVLKAFQRKVSADVPIPPGAAGIPDYLERGKDAR